MRYGLVFVNAVAAFLFAVSLASSAPKQITWDDLIPLSNAGKPMDFGKFGKPKGMPKLSEFGGSKADMDEYVESMEFMK